MSTASVPNPNCLMPFPACFFDRKTKTKNFKELKIHLDSVSKLDDIKEETSLPELTWELLYWVFTNPLTIEPITVDVQNAIIELRKITGLQDIPIPDNIGTFVFKMTPSRPKEKFVAAKAEFGSTFTFHGSRLENFHSIMHRGLVSALNKRSAFGFGTYLSSKLSVSRAYSEVSTSWPNSSMNTVGFGDRYLFLEGDQPVRKRFGGLIQCIAIVEVVKHPSIKKVEVGEGTTYHVVEQDDFMQLSHLVVFTTRLRI